MQFDKTLFDQLLEEWNRCHGAFYRLNADDLLWNLQSQELVAYRLEKMSGVPCLLAMASAQGIAAGLPAKSGWLSLCGEIPHAETGEFVRSIEKWAHENNRARLNIFGDEFHFLPGIPVNEKSGEALKQILVKNGFEGSESVDYVGELDALPVKKYTHDAVEHAAKNGWQLRMASQGSDLKQLEQFLERDFSGRWLREFRFWRAGNDTGRATWWLLNKQDGDIFGFARLSVRGRINGRAWNPGALRLPLSETEAAGPEDGCLGPIGVAVTARGQGAGKALLGLSLGALKDMGAKRICIDWTDAYNYYKPLEFKLVRSYWSSWKRYSG